MLHHAKLTGRQTALTLLIISLAGVVAVTGCKKTPPPAPPAPAADATPAAPDAKPADAAAPAAPQPETAPAAASSIPLKDPGAFQTTDPTQQALWQAALAAAQTNDWLATYKNLLSLRSQPGLDDGQAKTLDKLTSTVGMAMNTAAASGDEGAAEALSQLRRGRRVSQQ